MLEIAHGVVSVGGVQLTFAQMGIVLVVFVGIGVLGEEVARYKGHSPILWLILCSLFPLLLIAAIALKPKPRKAAAPQAMKKGGKGNGDADEEKAPAKVARGGKAARR
jgi:hypothetical protein